VYWDQFCTLLHVLVLKNTFDIESEPIREEKSRRDKRGRKEKEAGV